MIIETVLDVTYHVLQGVILVDEFTSTSNLLNVDINNGAISNVLLTLCNSISTKVESSAKVSNYLIPINSQYNASDVEVVTKSRLAVKCKIDVYDKYPIKLSTEDKYPMHLCVKEYRIEVKVWPL